MTDTNQDSTLSFIGAAHLMQLALQDLVKLSPNTSPRDAAAFVLATELTFVNSTLSDMAAGRKSF